MAMRFPSPCLVVALAACQAVPPAPVPPAPTLAAQGQSRAEALCGGCHAVGRDGASTHASAPPFHAVINQVDLRAATVAAWLRDAHNYPSEMRFSLSESEIDALVAYMLTLRDPNYRRSQD